VKQTKGKEMNDINEKCLEIFPAWLESLGEDVSVIMETLKDDGLAPDAKPLLIGGINYLFKALDLIPDGVDDIGYLDDAFVIRISAKSALEGDIGTIDDDLKNRLNQLGKGIDMMNQFLGEALFGRLEKYAGKLARGASRGRTVSEILEESSVFEAFSAETEQFVDSYTAPSMTQDENTLTKLKAFLDAKLPK
jgi:uncharacterized membrane protein YkvA (DUF1232 family)